MDGWEEDEGNVDEGDAEDTQLDDIILEPQEQPLEGEMDESDPFTEASTSQTPRRGIHLKDFAGIYDPPSGYVPHPMGNIEKMTIVDTSGVHRVHVQFCECHGIASGVEREAQLLRANLFPTSFTTFKSAFTFQALDGFRAANLHCKTSAFHYFEMLRRLTSPGFHSAVPVSISNWSIHGCQDLTSMFSESV